MPEMFDKKTVGENFSRSAAKYNQNALTQKYAAAKLCQMITPILQDDCKILDLGSGSGFIAHNLAGKNIKIFETDLSLQMLEHSKKSAANSATFRTQCDFENLPFRNHSFDILISSFSLQWLNDFTAGFSQFSALLKPGGILAFCLPSAASLQELRSASTASGCNFHFNQLPEVSDVRSALKKSGFGEEKFSEEIIAEKFSSGLEALKSIKASGAHYRGLKNTITKTKLEQFDNFCLKNFVTANKKISISWNISFFIAKSNGTVANQVFLKNFELPQYPNLK